MLWSTVLSALVSRLARPSCLRSMTVSFAVLSSALSALTLLSPSATTAFNELFMSLTYVSIRKRFIGHIALNQVSRPILKATTLFIHRPKMHGSHQCRKFSKNVMCTAWVRQLFLTEFRVPTPDISSAQGYCKAVGQVFTMPIHTGLLIDTFSG